MECQQASNMTQQHFEANIKAPADCDYMAMLGTFARLPYEIRQLIWDHYLTPDDLDVFRSSKRRVLSLMRASRSLYKELYEALMHNLVLNFTTGVGPRWTNATIRPSGIDVSDDRNVPFAFIPCTGPRRNMAVIQGRRLARKLPFLRARMIHFHVRRVKAGDLGALLRTWFEMLQMAEFIEMAVPSSCSVRICIHVAGPQMDMVRDGLLFFVAAHQAPDEIERLFRNGNVGIFMVPFLRLLTRRDPTVMLVFSSREEESSFLCRTQPPSMHAHVNEVYQKVESVITLWFYQRVLRIPGRVADLWRLDFFASWYITSERTFANLLTPAILNIPFDDNSFLDRVHESLTELYKVMRAFNPLSYRQHHSHGCGSYCCNGRGLSLTHDHWSEARWYQVYPSGIEWSASPSHRWIISNFADEQMFTRCDITGITVIHQSHPFVVPDYLKHLYCFEEMEFVRARPRASSM